MSTAAPRIRLRRLEITNYQAIKYIAFDIAPGVNGIAGRTAQGKSTIPQAVRELLQKGGVSSRPLRNGAAEGSIRAEFSDGSSGEKRLTAKGAQPFKRVTADGLRGGLESITGWITDEIFDPLAFGALAATKAGRRAQAETIMEIAGGDTSDIDEERAEALAEESAAGKAAADLEAQARGVVVPDDALPGEERPIVDVVDVATVAGKKSEAAQEKAANDRFRDMAETARREVPIAEEGLRRARGNEEAARQQYERAKEETAREEKRAEGVRAAAETKTRESAALVDPDTIAIDAEIAAAKQQNTAARAATEAHNKAVRAAVEQHTAHLRGMGERAKLEERARLKRAEEHEASGRKKSCDGSKAAAIAEAASKMPIAGLTIEGIGADREVFLNGAPLSQASTRERMAIGCAIALARNPRLGLLWIDYGNELDADAEAWLQDFLAANDADAFVVHVVSELRDKEGNIIPSGIVVEGGEVLADRRENAPAPTVAKAEPKKRGKAKTAPGVIAAPVAATTEASEVVTLVDDDAPPADW